MLIRILAAVLVTVVSVSSAGAFDLRRSTTSGALPPLTGPNPLGDAEVSINAADKRLIFKNVDGTLGYGSLLNAIPAGRQAVEQGQADALAVKRTGGTRMRPLSERAADTLNPLDFTQPGDDIAAIRAGTADAAPAFNAAIASRPSGSPVRLVVPTGTYRLDSADVANTGRLVTVDLLSGAKVGANYGGTGAKVLYVNRVESKTDEGTRSDVQGTGSSSVVAVIGRNDTVVNNGGNAVYGQSFNYTNLGTSLTNANGGDIGSFNTCRWPQLSAPGFLCNWEVVVSPAFSAADITAGKTFSMGSREVNPVNNSVNSGPTEFDSRSTVAGVGIPSPMTGGYLIAPDIWQPTGGIGGHVTYGLTIAGSRELNNRSPQFSPKFYDPLIVAADTTAPGGTSVFIGGRSPLASDGDAVPLSPLSIKYAFAQGINLSGSTFGNGQALMLGVGQAVAWSTAAGTVSLNTDSTGRLTITAPGGVAQPQTAWTTFTPTISPFTGAITSYTASGRWQRTGKRVDLTFTFTITNAGTGGGNGINLQGLPATVGPLDTACAGREKTNTNKAATLLLGANGTGGTLFLADGTYAGGVNNTLVFSCSYETN